MAIRQLLLNHLLPNYLLILFNELPNSLLHSILIDLVKFLKSSLYLQIPTLFFISLWLLSSAFLAVVESFSTLAFTGVAFDDNVCSSIQIPANKNR